MYPVAGASGGAILSPWLSIPTKFVKREPEKDFDAVKFTFRSLITVS